MGKNHATRCTNPECRVISGSMEVGAPCPNCELRGDKGKRVRDPKVPSLLVKSMDGKVISIIPVWQTEQVERIMRGLLRSMDMGRYYIDDSEFD